MHAHHVLVTAPKVAYVTGGASGIGKGTAAALAAQVCRQDALGTLRTTDVFDVNIFRRNPVYPYIWKCRL